MIFLTELSESAIRLNAVNRSSANCVAMSVNRLFRSASLIGAGAEGAVGTTAVVEVAEGTVLDRAVISASAVVVIGGGCPDVEAR